MAITPAMNDSDSPDLFPFVFISSYIDSYSADARSKKNRHLTNNQMSEKK